MSDYSHEPRRMSILSDLGEGNPARNAAKATVYPRSSQKLQFTHIEEPKDRSTPTEQANTAKQAKRGTTGTFDPPRRPF